MIEKDECPVCLSDVDQSQLTYPFSCAGSTVHGVCDSCAEDLLRRELLTCPVCRAESAIFPPDEDRARSGALPAALSELAGDRLIAMMEVRERHMRRMANLLPPNEEVQEMLGGLRRTVSLARELFNRPELTPGDFRDIMRETEQRR